MLEADAKCAICRTPTFWLLPAGNDIGFFDAVDSCIYHSQSEKKYGPHYDNDPDRVGSCAKAIGRSKNFLNRDDDSFKNAITTVYEKLLNSSQAKANPDLRIYQTGYAHFFNIDPASDWCNTHSFWPCANITLSHAVRADINNLVEIANKVVDQVTTLFADKKVGFVPISDRFNGHRFCEPNHTWLDQYFNSDVWFYNTAPQIILTQNEDKPEESNSPTPVPWPGPLFQFPVPSNPPGNSGKGSRMRPFHPNLAGFGVINDAIIAKLKADGVSGVVSLGQQQQAEDTPTSSAAWFWMQKFGCWSPWVRSWAADRL
jgi:hypothetical protein